MCRGRVRGPAGFKMRHGFGPVGRRGFWPVTPEPCPCIQPAGLGATGQSPASPEGNSRRQTKDREMSTVGIKEELEGDLTVRFRKATHKIHNLSNSLVSARLLLLFTDKTLYGRALSCFYLVHKQLDESLRVAIEHGDAGRQGRRRWRAGPAFLEKGTRSRTHRLQFVRTATKTCSLPFPHPARHQGLWAPDARGGPHRGL